MMEFRLFGIGIVSLLLASGCCISSRFLWSQVSSHLAETGDNAIAEVSVPESACPSPPQRAVANPLTTSLAKNSFPDIAAWKDVPAEQFCSDWQGHNSAPERKTEVQVLWSAQEIYLRFQARYQQLYLYPSQNQRQKNLWLRDVAEVFLQPPGREGYKEFEASPNGDWLAVDVISATQKKFSPLHCDVRSLGMIDDAQHVWTAELAIPMQCLTAGFNPRTSWRVNFFRIEGTKQDRFYSAWHPTNTEQPNFHVPEVFGELKFAVQ